MSEDNLILPEAVLADAITEAVEAAEAPKPARRKAPARRKTPALAADDALSEAAAASPVEEGTAPAKPKAKRAPRKPKVAEVVQVDTVTADLFATPPEVTPEPSPEQPATDQSEASLSAVPVLQDTAPAEAPAPLQVVAEEVVSPLEVPAVAEPEDLDEATEDEPAGAGIDSPAAPRRKRKRRRGRGERVPAVPGQQVEMPGLGEAEGEPASLESLDPLSVETGEVALSDTDTAAEPEVLPPLTIVSLGLEQPPVLSAAAQAALGAARLVLGSADALDRLQGLALDAPQRLCAADSVHLEVRSAGHAGNVLVVVGDAAGDGPAPELLAELGPAHVRVLPGVGRVQAACSALGLSAEIVSVVDLRRAPLAALRGQLRAHRLLAVPVADAEAPRAVARLLLDSGFAQARVWVCEFPASGLQARAWLASELVELREQRDARAVLVIATGPSSGVFSELPGLADAAFGDGAPAALPLAARLLALAWLQPAAWESGWAISDGEASLALEWARAVPTARVRAVGIEPSLLGVSLQEAGIGENLAATPASSPLRCREWPMPDAVFIRGGVGLGDWLAATWARLAPGGRLVATAEDDQARADLLAFSAEVPAEAWQEVSLARGETVAGRLRFAPGAPVRLALWRKPALS